MELSNDDLDNDNNPIESLPKDINKFLNDVKNNKNNDKKQIKMPKRYKSTILSPDIKFKSSNQDYTSNDLYTKLQDLINDKDTKIDIKSETKNIGLSITERKNVKDKKTCNSAHIKYINENNFFKKVKYYIDIKNKQLNENNKNNNKNEDSLSKIFEDFQKEQNWDNENKSQMKKNNVTNSYNKYNKNNDKVNLNYSQKNINEDERITNERKRVEEYYKKKMKSIRFNYYIDNTGKKITNNENDKDNNVMKNDSKTETNKNSDNDEKNNKKEVYQKYKSDLRPYMAFYYEKVSPFLLI